MSRTESLNPQSLTNRWERLIEIFAKERITRAASAMAFDLFLASIPMLAFVGWLTATVVHDSQASLQTISSLLNVTPSQVHEVLTLQFRAFSAGAVAPISALGALWMASSAFHTPLRVFEETAQVVRRSWVQKRIIALGCVLVGALALSLSGFATVLILGGPSRLLELLVTRVTGLSVSFAYLTSLVMALLTATGLLAAFYRIALRRPGFRRRVWPGALVAIGIGVISSIAFGYYATHLAQFRLFYGSLAAVAITLAWLWGCCVALLLGAEFNVRLEQRRPSSTVATIDDHEAPTY
ncbi:MAG: YihY/virulence factor BrkB family protein [Polyangiaceae bacterium]|nr:YihY/virulence factor BrkB family protein [Polyangiaceae bacterium]